MERDDFHTAILVQLGDEAGDRFNSTLLDKSLRQTLAVYSQTAPRLLSGTLTLSGAGQMQSLTALSGLMEVVELVFPYDAAASLYRPYAQPWLFTWRDGSPTLWLGGHPVPQAGEVLHVTYTAAHTISGLDGAAVTTLTADHEGWISSGALPRRPTRVPCVWWRRTAAARERLKNGWPARHCWRSVSRLSSMACAAADGCARLPGGRRWAGGWMVGMSDSPVIGANCHVTLAHANIDGGQPYGFVLAAAPRSRPEGVLIQREVFSEETAQYGAIRVWVYFNVLLADN